MLMVHLLALMTKMKHWLLKNYSAITKAIVVNSTKSMTGHLLGAAGAIETIVMAMAIETGKVHPTINCDNPDEGLDLDYVREGARDLQVKCALSNSFGFGGHNGTLCVRRYED
ncbi:MAG: hypothetical protein ACLRZ2_08715 [Veillonella sp.]